jgi:hypothetical protein
MKNFEDVSSSFFSNLLEGFLGTQQRRSSEGCKQSFLCFELENGLEGTYLVLESFFLGIGGLGEGCNSNLLPSFKPKTL